MTFTTALRRIPCIALLLGSLAFAAVAAAQNDDFTEAGKLFRSGQQAQALERVDKFLKANPQDARGRFLKGLILTEQGKQADAIKIFTGLTEDYPELPEPYNNLAVLYASQGEYEKARSALEISIRTHPSYATAYENLGDIYAKMASQAYDQPFSVTRDREGRVQDQLPLRVEQVDAERRLHDPLARREAREAVVEAAREGVLREAVVTLLLLRVGEENGQDLAHRPRQRGGGTRGRRGIHTG